MLLHPSNKFFYEENPFPTNLVRRKPLLHKLTYCLMANIQKLLCFSIGIEDSLDFLFFLNWLPPEFFWVNDTIHRGQMAKAGFDGDCLFFIVFTGFGLLPLDKDCLPLYNIGMQKTVPIRVRKETRDRLHAVKNPGQSLDGIITQMIDLWEKQKNQEVVAATGQEK